MCSEPVAQVPDSFRGYLRRNVEFRRFRRHSILLMAVGLTIVAVIVGVARLGWIVHEPGRRLAVFMVLGSLGVAVLAGMALLVRLLQEYLAFRFSRRSTAMKPL